eukprot:7211777-Prymnesium_polylepis.1
MVPQGEIDELRRKRELVKAQARRQMPQGGQPSAGGQPQQPQQQSFHVQTTAGGAGSAPPAANGDGSSTPKLEDLGPLTAVTKSAGGAPSETEPG